MVGALIKQFNRYSALSVCREVQGFLFAKSASASMGPMTKHILSLLPTSKLVVKRESVTIFQVETQISEAQRKPGEPFPAWFQVYFPCFIFFHSDD